MPWPLIPSFFAPLRFGATTLVLAIWLAGAGCSDSAPPPPGKTVLPFQGQMVRLLVMDDPGMAKAVRGLAGEWTAGSGATLEVRETTLAELPLGWADQCDAVIYPSHELGRLAEDLAPISEELLRQPSVAWSDILPLLRRREAMWNSTTVAVPLGSPVLALYYRSDWFAKLKLEPPKTWEDYQRLVDQFRNQEVLASLELSDATNFVPAAEPLFDGWAGLTLLARAAAYAKHPDYYSSLFDVETMAPRIAEPPFERALTELVAANGPPSKQRTMEQVWRALRAGNCAMAIAWPIGGQEAGDKGQEAGDKGQESDAAVPIAVTALPGSQEVYHPERQAYVPRSTPTVPLLAVSGRLGSAVRSKTSAGLGNQPAAMQLLLAMSDSRWGSVVSSASSHTTPFRGSHVSAPQTWTALQGAPAPKAYLDVLRSEMEQDDCLLALRIPGRAQYLAALDAAVVEALEGRLPAKAALEQAAEKWRGITEQIGAPSQQKAYRASEVRLF